MDIAKQRVLEQMSQRLQEASDAKGLPLHGRHVYISKAFADRNIKITPTSIGRWFHAVTFPSQANLSVLSDVLDVRYEWLAKGQGRMSDMEAVNDDGDPVKAIVREIPFLSYDQVQDWLSGKLTSTQTIGALGLMGKQTFAIQLQESSLAPELHRNLTVIVDPEAKIDLGDFIMSQSSGSTFFGRFVPRPDTVLVDPVNPSYGPVFVKHQEVVGKLISIAQVSL